MPRLKENILVNFEFKNEAIRANLQVNKGPLKWRPFWNKVYCKAVRLQFKHEKKFFFSTEGDRAYGFVRIETGDELSKRAKFAFITWIGESVSGLLKGKVSTDKSLVKQIIQVRV